MSNTNHTQVVRNILEREWKEKPAVSKYYVIEKIKDSVNPSELHNRAIAARRDTKDDGVKNIHRGAEVAFNNAIRSLKKQRFCVMDDEGWIRRCTQEDTQASAWERRRQNALSALESVCRGSIDKAPYEAVQDLLRCTDAEIADVVRDTVRIVST